MAMIINFKNNKMELVIENDLIAQFVDEYRAKIDEREDLIEDMDELSVDMSLVKNIDSVGITFIVSLYRKMYLEGKEFYIKNASEEIRKLFQLMKLDEVFDIE
jgi:anti-sigma B factor antagonist